MKNRVNLPDGSEIDFPLEEGCLRKFRLIDQDGNAEGPWCWLHPNDIKDHDNDVDDTKVHYGVTANMCLAGLPWGAVFPYKTNGRERPNVRMNDVIKWSNGEVVYHPECLKKIQDSIKND